MPGHAITCAGPGGCPGTQLCESTGDSYGECVCGDADAGEPPADGGQPPADGGQPPVDAWVGPDASDVDASMIDATMPDAAMIDAALADAAMIDAALADAAMIDATMPDAAMPDATVPDAAVTDAGVPDAASPPDAMVSPCSDYCATYVSACSGGLNEFGDSQAACVDYCATEGAIPIGSSGETSADTVGCRKTHANLASGGPALHCPHASSTGGDLCGGYCDVYCRLVAQNCYSQIVFGTDCATDCANALLGTVGTGGSAGDTSGVTIQCFIHYAGTPSHGDTLRCTDADIGNAGTASTACQ